MTLSAFQYMVMASTSYYNHEFKTDGNSNNDNDDRIETYLAEINEDSASPLFGAVTNLYGLDPEWAEFTFNEDKFLNPDATTEKIVLFNYDTHVKNVFDDVYSGFTFDRSGLDAKIFTDTAAAGTSTPTDKAQIVIAFAGTDKGYDDFGGPGIIKDASVDIELSTGVVTDQAYAAIYYTLQAKAAFDSKYGAGNYEVSFTGHSLGGHLASVVAAYFGNQDGFTGEAHIFNSAPQTSQINDVIQELSPPPLETNVLDDLGNIFPALPARNASPNVVKIKDYHLHNDALRTASRVDADVAQDISDFIDLIPNATLLLGVGLSMATGGIGAFSFGFLAGLAEYFDVRSLDTEPFGSDDYFSNGASETIDLGASVPFDYYADNFNTLNIALDAGSLILGQPTLTVKIANALINLHLGGQLLFMLDKHVQNNDFNLISSDEEQLPWFWTEAFNKDVVGFQTQDHQHPDTQGSNSFFQDLVKTKYANGDLGLLDVFVSQVKDLASVNLDNLLTVDGVVDDRGDYNIYETVVQHAIMQHTRNQIEGVFDPDDKIVDVASDQLVTVDLSRLDSNEAGVENYQVEGILAHTLAVRDTESLLGTVTIQDKLFYGFRTISGDELFPNSPIIQFVSSGETKKLYLDGSDNEGVEFIMDQQAIEQSITVTGAGSDTIQGNAGANLIFAGAGDDTITSGSGVYDDLIYAGLGSDTIIGSRGNDYLHGSETLEQGVTDDGVDTVIYSSLATGVTIGPTLEFGMVAKKGENGADGVDILKSIENFVLTDFDDTFILDNDFLTLNTFLDAGTNTAFGHDSLNLSLLSQGEIVVLGTNLIGFEEVLGSDYVDTITSDSSAHWLFGSDGGDYLYGQGGNDHLVGGRGADYLFGGTGNDTYYFSASSNQVVWQQDGIDTITDTGGSDLIFLSGGYKFNPNDFFENGNILSIEGVADITSKYSVETILYSDGARFTVDRLLNDSYYFSGSNILTGGLGNDYLEGQGTNVTYNASFGIDVIKDEGGGNLLTSSSYTLWKADNGSLVIDFTSSTSSVDVFNSNYKTIILDYFNGGDLTIDGNIASNINILSTNTSDVLVGTDGSDTLNGGVGNDYIEAGNADIVQVSEGDDRIAFTGLFNDSYTLNFSEDVTSSNVLTYRDVSDPNTIVMLHNLGTVAIENASIAPTIGLFENGQSQQKDLHTFMLTTFGSDLGDDIVDFVYLDGTGAIDITKSQDDEIYAGAGNDKVAVVNGGDDIVFGGVGDDIITQYEHEGFPTTGSVEFYGEEGDDFLSTISIAGLLSGGSGNDEIVSHGMSDILDGGEGDDILFAGSGDDTLFGGDGDDLIFGLSGGAKTVDAGQGNDFIIIDNALDDIVEGGDGTDILSFEGVTSVITAPITIDLNTQMSTSLSAVYSFSGIEGIIGTSGDDTIIGDAGDNIIDGGQGFSNLFGFAGNDTLLGGEGNDIYVIGTPYYAIRFAPGQDSENLPDPLDPIVGNDTISDTGGLNDAIQFTDFFSLSDLSFSQVGTDLKISFLEGSVLTGGVTTGSVTILDHFGAAQVENLILADGTVLNINEYLNWTVGNENDESLIASSAGEALFGLSGNDDLNASTLGNELYGGDGNDLLTGDIGNDTLIGGHGDDIINGGAGDDVYLFSKEGGSDIIADSSGSDILSISDDTNYQDLTFTQIGNDLRISLGSSVLIKDFYLGTRSDAVIDQIQFKNGSSFNLTSLLPPEDPALVTFTNADFSSYAGEDFVMSQTLFDNGKGVELSGNAWRKADFEYTVTEDTILSFEYRLGTEGEIHSIGVDFDDNYNNDNEILFKLDGTQASSIFNNDYNNGYVGDGITEYVTYNIRLGDYITGDMNYITFVNDHDVAPSDALSAFKNIRVFEKDHEYIVLDSSAFGEYSQNQADHVNQDVSLDGLSVSFEGNTWQTAHYDYTVTKNTVIEFNFLSTAEGEIHALGVDNDIFFNNSDEHFFTLGSSQSTIFNNDFRGYEVGDGTVKYTIRLGDYYEGHINYLTFINDHDVLLPENNGIYGNSTYSNIKLFEVDHDYMLFSETNFREYASGQSSTQEKTLSDDALTVTFDTDTWQHMLHDYTVTADTILEFDFRSTTEGGIHAIGIDTDVYFGAGDLQFFLSGTSNSTLFNRDLDEYDGAGSDVHYAIRLGDYVTGDIDFITFINSTNNSDSTYSNLRLYDTVGDADDNVIRGSTLDDTISGLDGNDILYGQDGLDTLIGGLGADTFVLEAETAFNNVDIISDYNIAEGDALDLSSLLSGYDALQDAITDFIEFTDNGSDTVVSVDIDGGADNFVQIATLTGVIGLTDEDALVTSGNLITV